MRSKDCVFNIIATEGTKHIIASQQIPYSHFKYDLATIWLVDGTQRKKQTHSGHKCATKAKQTNA